MPGAFLPVPIAVAGLIFTAWSYANHAAILVWTAAAFLTHAVRAGLYFAYRRRQPHGVDLKRWALFYTLYMFVTGIVWGAAVVIFLAPDLPVTAVLIFCGLYSLGSGSVAVNAYHLPSYYTYVATMFITAAALTLRLGDMNPLVFGVGAVGFGIMVLLFARLQSRVMRESIAMRFENIQILAEMKAARERAEAANLSKSQFLAAASHDLRQPLHALSLFSGALGNFRLGVEETAVVQHIQSNIAAMEGLFNGLLDLSRLEAGAVRKVMRPFAVQPVFDRLDRYFTPLASEKGLSLRLVQTGLWVGGDDVLTEQILMNLIANALRYTHEGGVVIGARRQGGWIAFQVSDSGEGIAEAARNRIFDEFVQIGNQERDRRKGLGLGLAISARTAALLGTRIALDSIPGKGSRFAFDLPRAVPAVSPAQVPRSNDPIGRLRLLIVDDDQAVREALDLLLKGWGVDFVLADGLDAARAALADGPFDVVISDYRLREGPVGLDFLLGLDAVKGKALVTGDVDPELMRRVDGTRIVLIHKPVDPARLRAMLNHLASAPAAQ